MTPARFLAICAAGIAAVPVVEAVVLLVAYHRIDRLKANKETR